MINSLRYHLTTVICILALALFVAPTPSASPPGSACDDGVDLQIITDKRVYAQETTMHVRFLVTNTDDTPLYLFSNIDQCSSPLGWLSLQIRDSHHGGVPGFDCAVDYLMDELNLAQQLKDSQYGVRLRKNEIFGKLQDYKLPKERGLYELQAEIGQVGFLTGDQEEALSKHQMRILRRACLSPVVTIEVK